MGTLPAPAMRFTKKVWEKKPEVAAEITKAGRYYPAEDVKKKLGNHHNTTKQTKLRANITPGTVLILLAGRFKGQRVVFLKQLDSGLLLITGPHSINGVPLRRVPQSYVIATSTKVSVGKLSVDDVDDAYFQKPKGQKKKDEDMFNGDGEEPNTTSAERKAKQLAADKPVVAAIANTPLLEQYLKAKFSLQKGDRPHSMKF